MTKKINIDKDIPIPPLRKWEGIYPWREMEVGDSFVSNRALNSVNPPLQLKALGWRFVKRTMPDGTVRVWRIK